MWIIFTYILFHERVVKVEEAYIQLLRAHVHQLHGEYAKVETFIKAYQPDIDKASLYSIATWVWLLQKHVHLEPQNEDMTAIDYKPYTDYLVQEWKKPHAEIWENEKDIYLSNVAMVYAALAETKMNRDASILQKVMTEIRDFVFDELLSGGTALNGVETRSISVDQTLAVMPYGLFSPEDLIIVEATNKMVLHLEEDSGLLPYRGAHQTSKAATAMMALYYLEKSDKENAFHYAHLARVHREEDELGEVVLSLFEYYASQFGEGEKIIHAPLGNENVYVPQLTERFPHYPALDDHVHVACQVISEREIAELDVHIQTNTKDWQGAHNLLPKMKEETLIYQGKLPPLQEHGEYAYRFHVTFTDGEHLNSDTYTLPTRQKKVAESFSVLDKTDNTLELGFGDRHKLTFIMKKSGMDMAVQQYSGGKSDYHSAKKTASISNGDYRLNVEAEHGEIILFHKDENIMRTHPLLPSIEWEEDVKGVVRSFQVHWYAPEDEAYYGFGERYNAIEQRGEIIDCYVYNQYRDQGTRTYIPVPFYMTNKGYGCFIDTAAYTTFDLAASLKDKCTWTFEQTRDLQETTVHFYFGDYKHQVQQFTGETGKPAMVPAWALGPWMSSNNWDRQSIVEHEIATTNKHSIPATVIVLEQWSDEATYYMFNDAAYELKEPGHIYAYEEMTFPSWGRWPDPKGMVEHIHEENLKLILWQIPIQKYLNKQTHPLKDQDETYMIDQGYVVKHEDGRPYRIPENWFTKSLIMDFSHGSGRKWWFGKRQYLLDIGVDGFKTDGGEFVFGKNLQFANGQTGSEMRNQYPNDYIQAYYDFAQQNDGITFSRAGYTGAQNFPAHWAGDERSTFAAFKRSLVAGLNAGLAGIVFWGWDLAGFNGEIPSAELFMRSSSMAAFCPIMQYHAESKAEFNQDRTPWNIASRTGDERVIEVYRFYANVRMNLMPYLYQESEKACRDGEPLMRALMLDYPEDERVAGMYDEYLFGESLLVAPVIEEDHIERQVYLPEGTWVNLWTEELHEGPAYITCKAEVEEIPVFIRMNRALLLNLAPSEGLGSAVGNDVSAYKQPVCRVYCDASFQQTLNDHLGHTIKLQVEVSEKEITVQADTDIDDLCIEVRGNEKDLRVL
ncbi:TIM-barrel domain-containing protein [Thalassobacillus sp. CUG 92003]|uniref:glycoside hydrolase family 31 protein n=1 Tax=Thalassobacillus sp. CUG 92003 TaxID=2736641 RepID=UPI0015E66D5A|nr:TIM-barrel domain-containing protein [Thalassobacillus sp. CUG 92003]